MGRVRIVDIVVARVVEVVVEIIVVFARVCVCGVVIIVVVVSFCPFVVNSDVSVSTEVVSVRTSLTVV